MTLLGMPFPPSTYYARSADVDIAYQVFGDLPRHLVFVPGWVWNVELAWELPEIARFFERLTRFATVVLVEKRGVGLSDRVAGTPTLEERSEDIRVVMDAVGVESATVAGWFDGAAMAANFAAIYPRRVSALVIGGMAARVRGVTGGLSSLDATVLDAIASRVEDEWGEGTILRVIAPSVADDARVVTFWRRFERMSATPNAAAALFRWNAEIDLSGVLPSIQAPTLVLNRSEVQLVPPHAARELARLVPGARYIELAGTDIYPFFGDTDSIVDAIEEFVTGAPLVSSGDRVLMTVVFVDIVGSTVRATQLGDRRWHDLLNAYYSEIRRLLSRFDGREVDTAGDGLLATFVGPARAIQFARAAHVAVREIGLEIRTGVHTGEVDVSGGKIAGLALHLAARVVSLANPGEILVTSTVKDLVLGSGIQFDDRGDQVLKGVPEQWHLFAVADQYERPFRPSNLV